MKRVVFVNRFFSPDHSATSQMVSQLAFHLAASGYEVHVITSQQLYDNAQASLAAEKEIEGVHVHRVSSTQFGRTALPGRAIDYLSFYASTWKCLLAIAKPGDIVIAKTDPPLISIPTMREANRRGAKLVNWLQDVYPEIAVELGVPFLKGPIPRAISFMRDRSLKSAVANVVVGERMADRIVARGVAPERIKVIHNWCDDEA